MNHLPFKIWELVAKYGKPDKPLGKLLLSMDEREMEAVEERQSELMEEMGIPNTVILAYQMVLILYVEHEAITRAVLKIGDPELRGALPEVLNRREAIYLMEREFNLTPEEVELLYEILPNNNPTERALEVHATWDKALPPRSNNG